jgi:alkanesulfonate monooxygenase SsuD/methylene tetrahydromethanopterin reductase-like flavin-dependent oxidoreductase (luciferase family)
VTIGAKSTNAEQSVLPVGRWPKSKRSMGIGIMMPVAERSAFGGTPRFQDILEIAQTAEAAGLDGVWLADHFFIQNEESGEISGVWEAWTMLAALAAATTSLTLGVFVTCTGFRHPGVIAKMTESLDEISGGRFVLGLGAGWHQPEYDRFGFPFDHRVSRFEDAITIIAPLLREGRASHQGRFYHVDDAVNAPRGPLGSSGGASILVGTGSPRMLGLTARFADAWNTVWHQTASSAAEQIEKLDAACYEIGRDPSTIVKTAGSNIAMPGYLGIRPNPITGEIDQIAEAIVAFRDLGLKHYVAGLDPCTPKSVEQFSRAVELFDRAS